MVEEIVFLSLQLGTAFPTYDDGTVKTPIDHETENAFESY